MMPSHLIGNKIGSVEISDYITEADSEFIAPILFSHMKIGSVRSENDINLYTGYSEDFRELTVHDKTIPIYFMKFLKHDEFEVEFAGFEEQVPSVITNNLN